MVKLLEKKIDDKRFIKLISSFLKAGYLEEWKYHETYSGTPQGGIVSPILSNIYLHELDLYIRYVREEFHVGKERPTNPEYRNLGNKMYRLRKKLQQIGSQPKILKELSCAV